MRQKSTTRAQLAGTRDLRLHNRPTPQLVHDPTPSPSNAQARRAARYAAPPTDRRQARRDPRHAAPAALAAPPTPRASSRDAQLPSGRVARLEQHDLRAPPLPPPVALRHVRDDSRSLQVIEPALHALAMRAHEPRPLRATAGNRAPGHHRRQPEHELLHGGRKPRRPAGVTEPEQVALDRVDPRLDPIITRRDTTARTTRTTQQGAHHQAARLVRQRRTRRPIPTTTRRPGAGKRCAFQRHRQRPTAPGARRTQRSRADARGAAGPAASSRKRASTDTRGPHPSKGVGDPSGARLQLADNSYVGAPRGALCGRKTAAKDRDLATGLFRSAACMPAARDKRPEGSALTLRREARNDAPTELVGQRERVRRGFAPAASRSLLKRAERHPGRRRVCGSPGDPVSP